MSNPPPLPPRLSPRLTKGLGWLFIFLGVSLVVGMAYITRYMIGVVNSPTVPGSLPRWSGSHEMTVRMFWMFGGVALFGVGSIANGIWALRYGSMNLVLRVLLVLLGVALFAGAKLMTNHH